MRCTTICPLLFVAFATALKTRQVSIGSIFTDCLLDVAADIGGCASSCTNAVNCLNECSISAMSTIANCIPGLGNSSGSSGDDTGSDEDDDGAGNGGSSTPVAGGNSVRGMLDEDPAPTPDQPEGGQGNNPPPPPPPTAGGPGGPGGPGGRGGDGGAGGNGAVPPPPPPPKGDQ